MADPVRLEVLMVGLDLVPLERPGWMRDAACAEPHEGVHFIPPFRNRYEVTHAKEVCAACLVRQECLAYALDADPESLVGVWGGTTGNERRRLRRNRPPHGP